MYNGGSTEHFLRDPNDRIKQNTHSFNIVPSVQSRLAIIHSFIYM